MQPPHVVQAMLVFQDEIDKLKAELAKFAGLPMKYKRMEFNAQLQKENNDLWAELAALQKKPVVLSDIEQYRLQIAAICTAAIGYWVESDPIHPDYDTVALRDVARLYAKYDKQCQEAAGAKEKTE